MARVSAVTSPTGIKRPSVPPRSARRRLGTSDAMIGLPRRSASRAISEPQSAALGSQTTSASASASLNCNVGGWHAERKHLPLDYVCDNVSAIVFIVAASEYNQVRH